MEVAFILARHFMSQGVILVTGATGKLGGAVVAALRRRQHHVLALVDDPRQGASLLRQGVGLRIGSLADLMTLDRALEGVEQVFLLTDSSHGRGPDREVAQGVNLVEAARAAAVHHIVFCSIASADQLTQVPSWGSKFILEEFLRTSGVPTTILRPVYFMENFAKPRFWPSIQRGQLALPMRGDRPLQLISIADIAELAARAIDNPRAFSGRTIELAGDELTPQQAASQLSAALGWQIRFEQLPEPDAVSRLGPALTGMFRWLDKTGFGVDLPALSDQLPLLRFDTLLARDAGSWRTPG